MIEIPFDFVSYEYHKQKLIDLQRFYKEGICDELRIKERKDLSLREYVKNIKKQSNLLSAYVSSIVEDNVDLRQALALLKTTSRVWIENTRKVNQAYWPNIFRTYLEFTSGSRTKAFGLYRSSHSVQREHLRLRYAINYYSKKLGLEPLYEIIYLSHYKTAASHIHTDYIKPELKIIKVTLNQKDIIDLNSYLKCDKSIISGTPSTLNRLSHAKKNIPINPIFILSAGEHLPSGVKKSLIDKYECPVFELYVMRECGLIGYECFENKGFHVFENDIILNVSERGYITMTDMTNLADVFINYPTGDYGEITATCGCGEKLELLSNFKGRSFGKPVESPTTVGW